MLDVWYKNQNQNDIFIALLLIFLS